MRIKVLLENFIVQVEVQRLNTCSDKIVSSDLIVKEKQVKWQTVL